MAKHPRFLLRTCMWLLLFSLPLSAFGADKVTLQLKWFHQFQFAGYYAAKEKGFYAAEGLDVVFRQRDVKTSYIDDVLEGKAQYGTADAGLLFSRLQGKSEVVLAQIFQHFPLVLLTLKESNLRTPYQLAGKKVMIDTIGFSDAPANGMLFKTLSGFDQFQPVQMTFRYEDLSENKVDAVVAYVTDQPFKSQEVGVGVNILDPRDYGIDFYGDNLFTTEKEIREHPQIRWNGPGTDHQQTAGEMMGGDIWVDSEPGLGTTFSFTANFGLGKKTVKKRLVPSLDLRGMKVLVVDASATSRNILQDILESFSFEALWRLQPRRDWKKFRKPIRVSPMSCCSWAGKCRG